MMDHDLCYKLMDQNMIYLRALYLVALAFCHEDYGFPVKFANV